MLWLKKCKNPNTGPRIKIITYLFLVTAAFLIAACGNSDSLKPNITGRAGEVIIVADRYIWENPVGAYIKAILSEEQPGLPQAEPLFDVVYIPYNAFTSILKTHRNLILIKIDNVQEPTYTIERNQYARPQTIVTLTAKNSTGLHEIFTKNAVQIIDVLLDAEKQRIISNYKKFEENYIREKLLKNHHLSMNFPKGYDVYTDTTNFTWISYETPQTIQGVFVYYQEYTDTLDFSLPRLIAARDSVLKKNVPGPLTGSYMATELENYSPIEKAFLYEKKYTKEIRGLWRVEGDFMGGPFISLSSIDEKRNRIVTVEGYVYAPKYDKRNYLRQVEAILYTLAFEE